MLNGLCGGDFGDMCLLRMNGAGEDLRLKRGGREIKGLGKTGEVTALAM